MSARARLVGVNHVALEFRDPWGNRVQVVQYADVQFTKAPSVLRGMGLEGLDKSPRALAELREKGLLGDGRAGARAPAGGLISRRGRPRCRAA